MNEFPELKTGMLVEFESGSYFLVLGKLAGRGYEAYKLDINCDGRSVSLSTLSIVREFPESAVAVYSSNVGTPALSRHTILCIADNDEEEINRTVIWQRKKGPLEVTMEEVCEKFGQEVKIVKAHA